MSKTANISIKYYSNTLNIIKLYKDVIFDKKVNVFNEKKYLTYMLDYNPIVYALNENQRIEDALLLIIKENKNVPLTFTLIYLDKITTVHTLNATNSDEINIAISFPKMLDNLLVPDFSYYAKIILPNFQVKDFKSVEFSYG